jgi:hypothetical protein
LLNRGENNHQADNRGVTPQSGVSTLADRVKRLAEELGAEFDSNCLNIKEKIAMLEKIVYGEERDGGIPHRVRSLEAELEG